MGTRTDKRREQILSAAAKLFTTTGTVKVAALSRASGASIGSIYHHFNDKQNIVLHAAEKSLDLYFESLRAELGQEAAKRVKKGARGYGKKRFVRTLVRHHLAYLQDHSDIDDALRHYLGARRLRTELGPYLPDALVDQDAALAAVFGLLLFRVRPDGPALEADAQRLL